MTIIDSQQYLIKVNEDLIYYFFLNNDRSLKYNIYTDDDVLLKNEKLASYIVEFSVTVDVNQKIHLVCITTKGELLYYINSNNNWKNKIIYKFDTRSNLYNFLSLHICDNYTHIICTKTNILTRALSTIEHIYLDKTNINKNIVSSYMHGKYSSPLQISIDSFKNIHLVYKIYYKNNHQLYYRKFNNLSKTWSSSELISNLEEDHCHPYIFIDTKNNLHLVWCTIKENNFILKYKKKDNIINTRSKWSNIQTLSNKNSNNFAPILIQQLNTLKIYCKQNEQIIEIVSNDFGDSWQNSIKNKLYTIKNPKIIQYCSSLQNELYLAKHIYSNITDVIETVGINIFNNKEQNQFLLTKSNLNEEKYFVSNFNNSINNNIDAVSNNKDLINLIKSIDKKIDNVLLQIIEYESKIEQSNIIANNLLSDYNILKNELTEIEKEKQNFINLINNYKLNINLLEEKIINLKDQMLNFEKNLCKFTSNSNIFERFINFFK